MPPWPKWPRRLVSQCRRAPSAARSSGWTCREKKVDARRRARPPRRGSQARSTWFEKFAGKRIADLVFLDEFGANTKMQRTHGRAAPGERVVAKVPHGHYTRR